MYDGLGLPPGADVLARAMRLARFTKTTPPWLTAASALPTLLPDIGAAIRLPVADLPPSVIDTYKEFTHA